MRTPKTVEEREQERVRIGAVHFRLVMANAMDNLTRSCMEIQSVFLRNGVAPKGYLQAQEELDAAANVKAWAEGEPDVAAPHEEWEQLYQVRKAKSA